MESSAESMDPLEYARLKVDPILKPLVAALLYSQPDDVVSFIQQHLATLIVNPIRQETIQEQQQQQQDDEDEDEEEEEEESHPTSTFSMKEPAPSPLWSPSLASPFAKELRDPYKRVRRRTGISAESVHFLEQEEQRTFTFPKSEQDKQRIRETIEDNILFSSLDPKQMNTVLEAMQERIAPENSNIITQGEEGDFFYILDQGEADCFVAREGKPPILVKSYSQGECFGELALMYSCPRQATIKAKTECRLWALDRVTFRNLLMHSMEAKQKSYDGVLSKVPILQSLTKFERAKISDALVEETFHHGDLVIRQGETGDKFYIIAEGNARVYKIFADGNEVDLALLGVGEFFGELALLTDNPRAANVVAQGELTTVALDRGSFTRLLGPIKEILKRNKENYEEIERKLYSERLRAISKGSIEKSSGSGRSLDSLGQLPSFPRAPSSHNPAQMQSNSESTIVSSRKYSQRRRTAVSAEPMSLEGFIDYEVPTITKSESQQNLILSALSRNTILASLDASQKKLISDAMFPKTFEDNDVVIQQGDEGDNFYVLEEGAADCFVNQEGGLPPLKVKIFGPGDSFGELALMYNSPRAASIIAKGPLKVFALDRSTFRRVVMETTNTKRRQYEGFLENVKILQTLDQSERAKVADALESRSYQDGEFVIKEGDVGDSFYIIVEGNAVATKSLEPNSEPVDVYHYVPGDYFGELSLLLDAPRAANVIAKGELKVLRLDRSSFVRLMGPCDEVLKRNMETYKKYEETMRKQMQQVDN